MATDEDRLMCLESQWKIIFNEQIRAPIYAVGHYVSYLRKYANSAYSEQTERLGEAISPMSYMLRKLKLDLKMSYDSFLYEFTSEKHDGLSLLLKLLQRLQNISYGKHKSASVSSRHSNIEEYKRSMTDENDCLLCIKFTLRLKLAKEQILETFSNLETVVWSLYGSSVKSRITALEILTLCLAVRGGFDKVFDTFTYMRLKLGESVRFKLLISMLSSAGPGQVLFQVACLRFLNTLMNCPSSGSLRVYLQEELRMAGLDMKQLEQNCTGDGLEFDDLRREVEEWKSRFINVDNLLRKLRLDFRSSHERRYEQVNYAVVHGQPHVSTQDSARLNSSKSVPNLTQADGRQDSAVTVPHLYNTIDQQSWSEERYNLRQIGHRLTLADKNVGDEARVFEGVPNTSYTFTDIQRCLLTYDNTCLTGDAPDVLLQLLQMNKQDVQTGFTSEHSLHMPGVKTLSVKLHSIPECEDRLKLMGFMNHFNTRLQELKTKISHVNRASESLLFSPKMKQFFEIILEFGSRMNAMTKDSEKGFKISNLESLSRSHVSSNDHTQTVLDYLVSEVGVHYPEVKGWHQDVQANIPPSVSVSVMQKQMEYLKNGVKILHVEAQQYPDVQSLQDFLSEAPGSHAEIEKEFFDMTVKYKDVCTMLGEDDGIEPRDLFEMVNRFAADYRLTAEKLERFSRNSVARRPVSGSNTPRSRKGSASKSDDIKVSSTHSIVDVPTEVVPKRRLSGLSCLQDSSTDNVPPAIARRKKLSKNKSVPQKSNSSKSWFGFGRKSKSLSQPNVNRHRVGPETFVGHLNKDGSSSKTSLDGNWVLHSREEESEQSVIGRPEWRSEPELSRPLYIKNAVDDVQPITFMFANKFPTMTNLAADVAEDGSDSKKKEPDESFPEGTMRSYNAELSLILQDFEETLLAHDADTPKYLDGFSSEGPVVFV